MKELSSKVVVLGSILICTTTSNAEEYYYDVKFHNNTGKYIDYSLSTTSLYNMSLSEKFILGKASKNYLDDSVGPKYFEPDEISRVTKVKTRDGYNDYWSFSMNVDGHQRGQKNAFPGKQNRTCDIYREDAISPVVVIADENNLRIIPYNSSACSWGISDGYSQASWDNNVPKPQVIYPTGLSLQSNNVKTLDQLISTQVDTIVESSVGAAEVDGRFNYVIEKSKNPELEQEMNEEYYKLTGIRRASDPKAKLFQTDNHLLQSSNEQTWSDLKNVLLDKLADINPNGMKVSNLRVYDKDIVYGEGLDFRGYKENSKDNKKQILLTVGSYADNNSDDQQNISTDTVSYTYSKGVSFSEARGWKLGYSQKFKFNILVEGEYNISGEYNSSKSETRNQTESATYTITSKTIKVESHTRKLVCSSLVGYSGEGTMRAGQKISGPIDIYMEEGIESSDGTILPKRGEDFNGGYLMHFDDIADLAQYVKDHDQTLPDWIEVSTDNNGNKTLYADIVVDANYINIGIDAITKIYDIRIDEKRSAKQMCEALAITDVNSLSFTNDSTQ
ncbi:ETX/MTX2 family pore-forming toxin [Francisella hispaniensis]|uniref:Uncharacterized protein n=1 Tax=Francisella hispaniensis TaxID=622488 RepID=F4BHR9_9GAMM|nr:ETX/MTX2 family pore-forming toxin [Francisella hispaniensis]AEE27013.1 hypothetical protein FN3523_1710 [Francisella hispaniensis]